MGTPQDADCAEQMRDRWLGWFVGLNQLFLVFAVISMVLVIGFGIWITILMFNVMFGVNFWGLGDPFDECSETSAIAAYMERNPDANRSALVFEPATTDMAYFINGEWYVGHCTVGQFWFGMCIKAFVIIFSYINFLPIPWRISIASHVFTPICFRTRARPCDPGLDFYGRPTEALWFHLEVRTRRWIAFWLNLAWVSHFVCLATQLHYWSYMANQTMPGVLATMLPFGMSILAQVVGGCVQSNAETALIKAHPGKFPPRIGDYVKAAWAKYVDERKEKGEYINISGFIAQLRAEVGQLKRDELAWRSEHRTHHHNFALTGVIVDANSRASSAELVAISQLAAESDIRPSMLGFTTATAVPVLRGQSSFDSDQSSNPSPLMLSAGGSARPLPARSYQHSPVTVTFPDARSPDGGLGGVVVRNASTPIGGLRRVTEDEDERMRFTSLRTTPATSPSASYPLAPDPCLATSSLTGRSKSCESGARQSQAYMEGAPSDPDTEEDSEGTFHDPQTPARGTPSVVAPSTPLLRPAASPVTPVSGVTSFYSAGSGSASAAGSPPLSTAASHRSEPMVEPSPTTPLDAQRAWVEQQVVEESPPVSPTKLGWN